MFIKSHSGSKEDRKEALSLMGNYGPILAFHVTCSPPWDRNISSSVEYSFPSLKVSLNPHIAVFAQNIFFSSSRSVGLWFLFQNLFKILPSLEVFPASFKADAILISSVAPVSE
jgi:hypothetical protein